MRKPSRDILKQYIYDLGYDAALEFWDLTPIKAENILFTKIVNRKPKPISEPKPIDTDKADIIWKVVTNHYKLLKSLYVQGRDIINKDSEDLEDEFHSALIKMVEDLERFEYIDDDKTLGYIKSRLYFQKLTDKREAYRNKNNFIQFTDDYEDIDTEIDF